MQYDPIKNIFAKFVKDKPILRILFYKILDLMFLRSWYVRREIKNAIIELSKKELSVYDAGTGFGQYTYFIAKNYLNAKILSVDLKEDYIDDCRKFFDAVHLYKVDFAIEDLTTITHKNKFDLIICVDVMEHIENDIQVFKNFYNALKPGGIVIINTPSIFGGSDVHSKDDKSFIDEHFRVGYSKDEFKEKLEFVGFKMRKMNYTYGAWGDRAWRFGIKYPILMLNFSKLLLLLLPLYYLLTLPFTLTMMYIDFKSDIKLGTGIIVSAIKK